MGSHWQLLGSGVVGSAYHVGVSGCGLDNRPKREWGDAGQPLTTLQTEARPCYGSSVPRTRLSTQVPGQAFWGQGIGCGSSHLSISVVQTEGGEWQARPVGPLGLPASETAMTSLCPPL